MAKTTLYGGGERGNCVNVVRCPILALILENSRVCLKSFVRGCRCGKTGFQWVSSIGKVARSLQGQKKMLYVLRKHTNDFVFSFSYPDGFG